MSRRFLAVRCSASGVVPRVESDSLLASPLVTHIVQCTWTSGFRARKAVKLAGNFMLRTKDDENTRAWLTESCHCRRSGCAHGALQREWKRRECNDQET